MKLETRNGSHSPYIALSVVCFGLIIVVLDNSILNIAIPELSRDLGASTSDLQWIIDAYTLVYAGIMLTAGALGDRFGRRRSLFWGVAGFGASSALASLAHTATMLTVARGLMGACGAFMTPASLSIVTNLFHDSRERARAIGFWAAASSVGVVIGPVVGGLLLSHFWWGSVFLVNVPIAIGLLIALPIFVPETKNPGFSSLDPLGAALSIIAMTTLLWATIAGPDHGWTSTKVIGGFVIGLFSVAAFIWWESTCENPMLDVGFFKIAGFSAATMASTAMVMAWAGTSFIFVQLLQSVLGFSPLRAGIGLTPVAVVSAVGGLASTPLATRIGRRITITFGLALQGAGAVLFLTYQLSGGYWTAITYLLVFSIGQSLVFTQCVASAMDAVPRVRSGVASGASNTLRTAGMAFGIAIIGSIMASSYRSHLTAIGSDLHLPADLVAKAGRSIASAVAESKAVGGDTGAALFGAAKDAFVPAFHSAMLVALICCILGIIVAAIWIPEKPTHADPDATRVEPLH